jgi:hypothetical protein
MKKVVFYTHVTDDWFQPVGAHKLIASAKHFHPNIPFIVFNSEAINQIFKRYPWAHWDVMIPFFGEQLSEEYDLVVHFDADSIITDTLDELLEDDYEVAGVRNNCDNAAQSGRFFGGHLSNIIKDIRGEYLNAGLIAARNKQFWIKFIVDNHETAHKYSFAENDVFNALFHSGVYKTKILDRLESRVHYGISSIPGPHIGTLWPKLYVENNNLCVDGKKIKVIHEAGGHHLPKLRYENAVSDDVCHYLNTACCRQEFRHFL